jgi:COP9 signalosome complex subunit 1
MQQAALQAAEDYERQALDRLRWMGLVVADLELKGGRKMGVQGFPGQGDFAMEETLG